MKVPRPRRVTIVAVNGGYQVESLERGRCSGSRSSNASGAQRRGSPRTALDASVSREVPWLRPMLRYSGPLNRRHSEREASFISGGLKAERAAVSPCNLVGDIKTEAQTLPVVLHGAVIEGMEEMIQSSDRYRLPGISDEELEGFP